MAEESHAVIPGEGAPIAALPQVTPQAMEQVKTQLTLLQGMVKSILQREIDYGRIPGTPQDSLWDPGASLIISAFGAYAGERRILKLEDDDNKIAVCIEVPIVSRHNGQVIGTGIGAASTMEVKYKYRWVEDPAYWGYEGEALKKLKRKTERDKDLYRIPNPEHSELLNTIIKIGSKRAEVDGAESLPGVATVLKQLFTGKFSDKAGEGESPVWKRYHAERIKLGYTEEQAHMKLGVRSTKDWLASGRSLDEALDVLRGKNPQTQVSSSKRKAADVTKEDVPNLDALKRICSETWGMSEDDVAHELGYKSMSEVTMLPWECFLSIKSTKEEPWGLVNNDASPEKQ